MSIATDIIQGKYDNELNDIQGAVNTRRKLNRNQNQAVVLATINVKDIVVLHGLTPKLLNGLKGKVTDINRTTISVMLDEKPPRSNRRGSRQIGQLVRVPAVCVKKV